MTSNRIFRGEIITPMFLYGANDRIPELRPPSIKGMMRFWWRSINGDLSVRELRKKEGAIFGGIDKNQGQSTFSILAKTTAFKTSSYQPLPHHTGNDNCPHLPSCKHKSSNHCIKGFKKVGFSPGGKFEITLLTINTRLVDSKKMKPPSWINDLFEISCFLGGFGNRSRRGFGSVTIEESDQGLELICNKLNNIYESNIFVLDEANHLIVSPFPPRTIYPSIKRVELGQRAYSTYQGLLKTIGNASHKYNPSGSDVLGKARKNDRLSSPVYVSVLKIGREYKPIVTILNIIPDKGDLQNKFVEAICK